MPPLEKDGEEYPVGPQVIAPYPINYDIDNRFTYHAPTGPDQIARYARIRDIAKGYAYVLTDICPPSPELDRAISHLDECVMSANASIARYERAMENIG